MSTPKELYLALKGLKQSVERLHATMNRNKEKDKESLEKLKKSRKELEAMLDDPKTKEDTK